MSKLFIFVPHGPGRTFLSKAGKEIVIKNIFVALPNSPFPVEFGAFDVPAGLEGWYEVGFYLNVYNSRLNVNLDWSVLHKADSKDLPKGL